MARHQAARTAHPRAAQLKEASVAGVGEKRVQRRSVEMLGKSGRGQEKVARRRGWETHVPAPCSTGEGSGDTAAAPERVA